MMNEEEDESKTKKKKKEKKKKSYARMYAERKEAEVRQRKDFCVKSSASARIPRELRTGCSK